MKKTLVALVVAAFATSASALTVYEKDGSKVDFDGSVRLRLDKTNSDSTVEANKVKTTTKTRGHSDLHNNGSRFGVKFNHNIADDFFGFGRVEFRFNKDAKNTDQFGDLYAHRAYVGLGSKQVGELSFGRQVTISADVSQSGFDNYYGTFDGTLTDWGHAVVRYDYKGVKGLQVGVDYRFAGERVNGEVPVGKAKSGYGAAAIYELEVAANQSLTFAAGYTRDNLVSGTKDEHAKNAYQAGIQYVINNVTLAADYAGASVSKGDKNKEVFNGFRVGAKVAVTPAVALYTNYGHGIDETKMDSKTTEKKTASKLMLGSSYKVHKNIFTYVEGGMGTVKTTNPSVANSAVTTDKETTVAVGLNVSW